MVENAVAVPERTNTEKQEQHENIPTLMVNDKACHVLASHFFISAGGALLLSILYTKS